MNHIERNRAAKKARFDAVVANAERHDDKQADASRRLAAHAHLATHHAIELDTPEAHQMAAQAHDKVADMHREAAEACEESDGDEKAAR